MTPSSLLPLALLLLILIVPVAVATAISTTSVDLPLSSSSTTVASSYYDDTSKLLYVINSAAAHNETHDGDAAIYYSLDVFSSRTIPVVTESSTGDENDTSTSFMQLCSSSPILTVNSTITNTKHMNMIRNQHSQIYMDVDDSSNIVLYLVLDDTIATMDAMTMMYTPKTVYKATMVFIDAANTDTTTSRTSNTTTNRHVACDNDKTTNSTFESSSLLPLEFKPTVIQHQSMPVVSSTDLTTTTEKDGSSSNSTTTTADKNDILSNNRIATMVYQGNMYCYSTISSRGTMELRKNTISPANSTVLQVVNMGTQEIRATYYHSNEILLLDAPLFLFCGDEDCRHYLYIVVETIGSLVVFKTGIVSGSILYTWDLSTEGGATNSKFTTTTNSVKAIAYSKQSNCVYMILQQQDDDVSSVRMLELNETYGGNGTSTNSRTAADDITTTVSFDTTAVDTANATIGTADTVDTADTSTATNQVDDDSIATTTNSNDYDNAISSSSDDNITAETSIVERVNDEIAANNNFDHTVNNNNTTNNYNDTYNSNATTSFVEDDNAANSTSANYQQQSDAKSTTENQQYNFSMIVVITNSVFATLAVVAFYVSIRDWWHNNDDDDEKSLSSLDDTRGTNPSTMNDGTTIYPVPMTTESGGDFYEIEIVPV